ncbi:hypothetical protein QE412_001819 [Microbacterium trichothecenolyticum]|uniref:Uncharacterized protein n=1 Tax=Microbacterium trichothecenolyticum TaxID=69370 RepID=A0ABU0TUA8_MICTR|nr:hypothetical protein [Microbacterium trichothecenolyticum]
MERWTDTDTVGGGTRCTFEWCTTAHGATVDPADEDHRSEGFGWVGRVRDGRSSGPGFETDIEVGVLRRFDDSAVWIVIETGAGISLALSPRAARTLGHRLLDDPDVRSACESLDSVD